MLWVKAFHIIAMTAWFAGLFYLPRLFVYHADLPKIDQAGHDRFCTMERRLFWGIMTPNAIITLLLGVGLVHMMGYSFSAPPLWLSLKLSVVSLVIIYHLYCGILLKKFKQGANTRSALYYRIFNELSIVMFSAIVLFVVLKPH
ncbi:CopD family protein [Candidatus Berkiella aquae]|uniref:Protoporphyrinogen IX oxidase n=1 Tax=Candidatus Berkiella aquae TaxID=295108 RepID=A0A0Q9YIX6_9GAMM|nr:CopD family protein [Candidatus Berkiella aquae]MCS5710230.1 CopD family protein [Candidatus Berkiella aquae]